jgi:hypothetical protein
MRNKMRFVWLFLTVCGVVGFAWGTVDGLERQRATPATPADRTLAELETGAVPRWVRLVDGAPRCDRMIRANGHDVVPVQSIRDDVNQPSRLVLVALENDELCAAIQVPVLVKPLHRSAYAERVLDEAHVPPEVVVADDVFELEPDAVGTARENVFIPLGLMLACIGGLAWQVHALRRRPRGTLGAVGDVAAAPASGAFEAIAHGASVSADESMLPPAPLLVSTAAQRHAWRQKHVGPAFLVVCAVALVGLSAWGTVGVVNDLRAWYGGVPVRAELKGSTTSKLIVSILEVKLAWQMPAEERVRTADRVFMTLWMPDDDGGSVRALASDPDVVTFEEAVDLVPFRIPLLLGGFGFAFGALVRARNTRRNADLIHHVAATGVEGLLQQPVIAETRVNGATTGWTVSGVLDGKAVTTSIPPSPGPNALVMANGRGDLLVVKSADGAAFVPLYADGEPFAWSAASWARAQAVLQARGSPTRLTTSTG